MSVGPESKLASQSGVERTLSCSAHSTLGFRRPSATSRQSELCLISRPQVGDTDVITDSQRTLRNFGRWSVGRYTNQDQEW